MIFTSATQLSAVDRCQRYAWLKVVAKCPEPKKGYLQFGNILHAAAERFLKGEDPWPSGWDYDEESKARVTPAEAALIQVLIQSAIEQGYLERRPGSRVEHEIALEVIPGVRLRGYIDHHDIDLVEDHKTGKSVRYFKSANALKEDLQLMIYAKWLLVEYWESKGKQPPKIITLAHNQFLKDLDNPEVRRRAAEVSPQEIQAYFETRVKHLAKLRLELEEVKDPFALPDPPKEACNAYGGCPFVSICAGQETYLTYKKRMSNPLPTTPMTSTSPMDFLNRRNAAAASPAVNPPPPAAAPAQASAPAPATAAPPWAYPGCQVCSKTATPGFNSKKQPCRMCVATTKHPISDYEWATQPDGRVTWSKKGETVATLQQAPAASGGTKTAYTSPDFVAKLKTCKTTDEVGEVLQEAQKALGEGTDMDLVTAAAETLLDEIIDASSTLSEKRLLEIVTSIASQSTLQSIEGFVTEAGNAGATPEQMAKVNDAAQKRVEWLQPQQPQAEAPAKRGPGRPRKDGTPAQPTEAPVKSVTKILVEPTPRPAQVRVDETNPQIQRAGLVLVIGAEVTLWPGVKIVFAEDILNQIPGYWQTISGGAYDGQAAFRRRDAVRAAASSRDGDFIKGLDGVCIVQRFRDPDVSNLMSALLPHAQYVVTGQLL